MDAYDMPKEFAKLAAQDMGKVGAMQDLVRGVEKLVPKKEAQVKETVIVQQSGGPNIAALLKRGQQALEDGDWDKAKGFFDQVLSMDAENAEAFWGLFLAGAKCSNEEQYISAVCSQEAAVEMLSISPDTERIEAAVRQYMIKDYLSENQIHSLFQSDLGYPSTLKSWKAIAEKEEKRFKVDRNLVRAIRYAKDDASRPIKFKAALSAALEKAVREAQEQERTAEENKRREYGAFLADAEEKVRAAFRDAQARQEAAYQDAMQRFEQAKNLTDYQSVQQRFLALASYRDSAKMITRCVEKLEQIKQAEAEEAERQRIAREKAEKAAQVKKKRLTMAAVLIVALAVAAYFTYTKVIVPGNAYRSAEALYEAGQYEQAIAALEALGDYRDSAGRIEEAREAIRARDYAAAEALYEAGQYEQAIAAFEALGDYRDSAGRIGEAREAIRARDYAAAEALYEAGQYEQAIAAFKALGDYKDSAERLEEATRARDYAAAETLLAAGQYEQAYAEFVKLKDYKDVDSLLETDEHLIAAAAAVRKAAFTTIGNTVSFGEYEQDNNTANGKEPIEWVVLATEGDRSLVISKYALGCKSVPGHSGGSVPPSRYAKEFWAGSSYDECLAGCKACQMGVPGLSLRNE